MTDKDKILTSAVSVKPQRSVSPIGGGGVGYSEGFQQRMATSLLWAGTVIGRQATQREVGDAAAQILKRKQMPERTVSRYFGGREPPSLRVIEALAEAMHVDPGWLAFGDKCEASPPPLPAAQLSELVPRPGKRKKA